MDTAVVIIYLVAVILVGLNRGYKTKNIKEFAVGKRDFSVAVLMATISATYVGGGATMGTCERIYQTGLIFCVVAIACEVIYKLILLVLVIPRFSKLSKYISMGEIMGGYYGKSAQFFTGVLGSIKCVGLLATQTVAMALVLQYFLGSTFEWAVILGGGTVILYTCFGGIRAVAATDFIQFSVLILGMVVIFNCALAKVGGYQALWERLPGTHKGIFSDVSIFWDHLLLLFLFSAPFLDPAQVQRLLLSKSNKKIRISMLIALLIDPVFYFMIGFIGLAAVVLFPNIDGNLALLTIVKESLPNAFLRGLSIAGLLAVVMSTADSYLNSATLALVNDVMMPLNKKWQSSKHEIIIVRIATIVIGSSSVLVALYFHNIIDIVIAFISFWGTFMFVPFFAGLFGFRGCAKSFWASTCLGIPSFFIWSQVFYEATRVPAIFVGLIMSFLGFISFYPQKSGLKKNIIDEENKQKNQAFCRLNFTWYSWADFKSDYRRKMALAAAISGEQYALFSAFCIANYLLPFLVWAPSHEPYYFTTIGFRLISGVLCLSLVFHDYLPLWLKPWRPWLWYGTLCYCLPFLSTLMFISNQMSLFWLMSMCLSLLLLATITDWESFVVLFVIGVGLAFACSWILFDYLIISMPWIFVYLAAFSLTVGAVFSRRKERENQEKINNLRELSSIIAHQLRTPLVTLSLASQNFKAHMPVLIDGYRPQPNGSIKKGVLDYLRSTPDDLYRMSRHNLFFIDMMIKKFQGTEELRKLSYCSMEDCIRLAITEYPIDSKLQSLIDANKICDFKFWGDETLTVHMLFNLLSNSLCQIQQKGVGHICLHTSKKSDNNVLHFTDDAGGIPKHIVPTLFTPFIGHGKSQGIGIGLAFCNDVMRRFGGGIKCVSDGKKFTEFQLVFPGVA